MACIKFAKLFDYALNREDSGERAWIYAHLSTGCPVCVENLRWVEMIVTTIAEDQSFEFSEETIAAIVARFKEQMATGPRPVRKYIARLVFDSGLLLPESAPVRVPSKKIVRRQELYHAEGYDIDLLFVFYRDHNDEQLAGQVVPEDGDATEVTPFKVELLQDGSVVSATNTDRHGMFEFSQLMSETYDLKVYIPDGEINLERVPTARSL